MPRPLRASKSRRSASVSAKLSTGQAPAKAFGRFELEAAEGVVDVARIDSGMLTSDLMGLPPQRFGMQRKRALWLRQIAKRLLICHLERISHLPSTYLK